MKKIFVICFCLIWVTGFTQTDLPTVGDFIKPQLKLGRIEGRYKLQIDTTQSNHWANIATEKYVRDYSSANGQIRMAQFLSVAALKASNYHSLGFNMVFTSSYYGDSDRQSGAKYVWVDTSTAIGDDRFVIQPSSVSGSGRWKYVAENGMYNIRQLGAKGDATFDNKIIIQAVIDRVPLYGDAEILVPTGTYLLSDSIKIIDRAIHLNGVIGSAYSNNPSRLLFVPGKSGLIITRTTGIQKSVIENLLIQAGGKDVNDTLHHKNGIDISAVTYLKHVTVSGFSGNGVYIHGDVGAGQDASLSSLENVECSSNGGSGFFIGNAYNSVDSSCGDCNQITFLNCDARDNSGWGFEDYSFLGNGYFGCHGNANAKGHYFREGIKNVNARSSYIQCYGEGGSPASRIGGSANIVSGLHYNGVIRIGGGTVQQEGNYVYGVMSFAKVNDENVNHNSTLEIGNGSLMVYTGSNSSQHLQFRNIDTTTGKTHYAWEYQGANLGQGRVSELLSQGTILQPPFATNGGYDRSMISISTNENFKYIQGKRFGVVQNSINDILTANANGWPFFAGDQFHKGDFLVNGQADSSQVPAYECISNGTIGTYSEGRTVLSQSGSIITLDAPTAVLKVGDGIIINGSRTTILYFEDGATQQQLHVSPAISASEGQAIAYAAPIFKSIGNTKGTTAQRPTLGVQDAGFIHFNTDTSRAQLWTGTSWVSIVTE